jgi:hypothetical protein
VNVTQNQAEWRALTQEGRGEDVFAHSSSSSVGFLYPENLSTLATPVRFAAGRATRVIAVARLLLFLLVQFPVAAASLNLHPS